MSLSLKSRANMAQEESSPIISVKTLFQIRVANCEFRIANSHSNSNFWQRSITTLLGRNVLGGGGGYFFARNHQPVCPLQGRNLQRLIAQWRRRGGRIRGWGGRGNNIRTCAAKPNLIFDHFQSISTPSWPSSALFDSIRFYLIPSDRCQWHGLRALGIYNPNYRPSERGLL